MEQYAGVQQLMKKENGQNRKPIYPPTVIQAVFDAKTGASLEAILAQFNSVYVQYQGTPKDTRLIIPMEMRRAGLTITYMDMDSSTITERANSAVQKDNDHWALDVNWSRVDELSLSGDISVSAKGTWIINGKDTGVKALGPKGDAGLTPWLKTIDNKLHFSYDNVTWEPCSENIAAWFRWSGNKIQISRDNKTWTDFSGKFADNVHIKGYVANYASLPSGVVQGDIYGVGPTYAAEDTAHTNPIYRYYVRNANSWVDNGSFTSLSAGVVQETGDSETEVMSQKAVSEKLSELKLRGANEAMVFSNKYTQVKAGRVYRIVVKNPNINVSEISDDYFSSGFAAFSVVGSCEGGGNYGLMPDVMLTKDVVLNNYYDVIIPDGIEYLYIGGRWSSEYTLTCFIEDVTDIKISSPLSYGSFSGDTQNFVSKNDRIRTDKIRLSGEGSYFYINYKGDNLIPTTNAILFKDNQYVGTVANVVKRGTISIPNNGTFDSFVIVFKKEDETAITNDERLSYKVYVNEPMTEMINIDSPNQYIVKLQFELGGLGSSKGKPYGALRDETQTRISRQSLYMSFDGTYDTIVSELGICTIYCYDHNFKFIYSVTAKEEIPSHAKYIKLLYNEILREKNIVVCSKKEPKLFKNGMYDEVYPRYVQLSYEVDVPPIGDIDATMDYVGSNGTISWNNGYIMLPENYDSKGEPVPLIIFCHGTNGYLWSQDKEVKNYDEYVRFLCKNGYAVADCSTLTNVYANSGVRDINVSHSLSVECYCKLYKYIISHFNVKEDGAYIFGKSAGGLNSIVLSYLQVFPIKACGELAPSLDTFVNMRYITNYEDINWSFEKLGIKTDYTSNNPLYAPTVEKIQYLIDNHKKTMGYNPMLFNVVGLDVESFYNEVMSMNWSTFSYNAKLMEIISKASKIQSFPLKIWQALDDNATPIAMSKMYKDMVVNGGGMCVLRELPEGCGQHHAVDNDTNAPKVDYLCKNGEIVNIPVAYAELVDWFNQW